MRLRGNHLKLWKRADLLCDGTAQICDGKAFQSQKVHKGQRFQADNLEQAGVRKRGLPPLLRERGQAPLPDLFCFALFCAFCG